ncbi:DUF952 domain-containing protein [Thermopolyspora sp. NPDC052614]|uniref:DUF952 domain-containing protein n=1 Tax=Thermopolyspora sp. NPDC052614 TaxID=3155682 RepID=UPI00344A990C
MTEPARPRTQPFPATPPGTDPGADPGAPSGTPAAQALPETPGRTGGDRTSRTILHLALATDWHKALAHGEYRVSTIGRTLDQEGFIHASADTAQLHGVAARYYADIAEPLLVLTIDTGLLPAPVRLEVPDGAAEAFPHIYGPIPITAVIRTDPYRRPA